MGKRLTNRAGLLAYKVNVLVLSFFYIGLKT